MGKVVEHHSRCANCVAILIILTFFNIYIKCDTSVALCSFFLRVTHTKYFFICFLVLVLLISSHYCSSFRCHFNLLSTFFFLSLSHSFCALAFISIQGLFCFLSFLFYIFFLTHLHAHTAGFSLQIHALVLFFSSCVSLIDFTLFLLFFNSLSSILLCMHTFTRLTSQRVLFFLTPIGQFTVSIS